MATLPASPFSSYAEPAPSPSRHSWLSSVSRCLGPTHVVTPFIIYRGNSHINCSLRAVPSGGCSATRRSCPCQYLLKSTDGQRFIANPARRCTCAPLSAPIGSPHLLWQPSLN